MAHLTFKCQNNASAKYTFIHFFDLKKMEFFGSVLAKYFLSRGKYVENEKICQKSFQHKKCYKCGKVLSKKPVFCLFQAVFQKNQVFFSTFSTIFLLKTCVCSICADCTNVRFLPFFYFKNVN